VKTQIRYISNIDLATSMQYMQSDMQICSMQYAVRDVACSMQYAVRDVACSMQYAVRDVVCSTMQYVVVVCSM
jgi:hypothetical protein